MGQWKGMINTPLQFLMSSNADPLAPVLMTLAGIAYGKPSEIPRYLEEDALTRGEWEVVWSPTQPSDGSAPPNFALIARSSKTGAYVIAIRGTYPNPFSSAYWDDASQDSPFGDMQPWPGVDPGAKVSAGTWEGFGNLIALAQGSVTLEQAVGQIPAEAEIYVTGHSLGGTLCQVIGLWLTELPSPRTPTVYAFAGMTPGNAAFAALFGPGQPLHGRVWRYNNVLDTVPYGWDRVTATKGFYQPAPRGGYLVEGLLELTKWRLRDYGYTSIGTEVSLPGTVVDPGISCEIVGYVWENLHQHLPDTYLQLLGAPTLPFTIGVGSVVHDGESALREVFGRRVTFS